MSEYETIDYHVENGVAWVRLNRPDKLNSFNDQMQAELSMIWRALRDDDQVGAAILCAAGERAFCTGIDRSEAIAEDAPDTASASPADTLMHFDDPGAALGPKANDLWKPVIGAVRGIACGGAFYMLGEVDILICSEDATFFDPHVTYGMVASYETIQMAQKMPFGELLRMQLLGAHERLSAETAHRIGLVSSVHGPEDLSAAVEAEARRFRHIPANQLALNKLLINQAYENMGLRTSQVLGTFFDGVTRHTEEAYRWAESFADKGFRDVIRERDAPWEDYGESPR